MRAPVGNRYSQSRQPMAKPIGNPMRGVYTCPELRPNADRPAAANAFELPSRMNNRLHYRDGRVTDLQGNPITIPTNAAQRGKGPRHG